MLGHIHHCSTFQNCAVFGKHVLDRKEGLQLTRVFIKLGLDGTAISIFASLGSVIRSTVPIDALTKKQN